MWLEKWLVPPLLQLCKKINSKNLTQKVKKKIAPDSICPKIYFDFHKSQFKNKNACLAKSKIVAVSIIPLGIKYHSNSID